MYRGTDLYMEKARLFRTAHNLFIDILPHLLHIICEAFEPVYTWKFLAGYRMKQNMFIEVYQ